MYPILHLNSSDMSNPSSSHSDRTCGSASPPCILNPPHADVECRCYLKFFKRHIFQTFFFKKFKNSNLLFPA